jgi:hypothetical protein
MKETNSTAECPGLQQSVAARVEKLNRQFDRWSGKGKVAYERPIVEFEAESNGMIFGKVYYVTPVIHYYGRGPNECYPDEQEHEMGKFPVTSRDDFHSLLRKVRKIEAREAREQAKEAKAEWDFYGQQAKEEAEEVKLEREYEQRQSKESVNPKGDHLCPDCR